MAPNRISTCDRIVSKNLNGISCEHSFVQWAIIKLTFSLLLHLCPSLNIWCVLSFFRCYFLRCSLQVWSPLELKDGLIFSHLCVMFLARNAESEQNLPSWVISAAARNNNPVGLRWCLPLWLSDCWVLVPRAVSIIIGHNFHLKAGGSVFSVPQSGFRLEATSVL